MLILPKAIEATGKIKFKALISEIKASLSSPLGAITRAFITVYLPEAEEISEPFNREDSPLAKDPLSVYKLEKSFSKRNECSIKYFNTAAD